ncbi:hypothetical protein [Mycobacteroides abscessus]|uniref:hypothetical protein n=1 Tax=Mycobacteroides abscessus TaxID=36809 RepID=UPI0009A576F5|nr:hypothetical protein [Mycobacteroides abscessus]SKK24911.1 type IV secretory pathway VirD4 components-like protein [Mycobacteroides abscessus subsp. massiliense]SKK30339.1 type IV secretory pathway VirD4 components-like protein [Mycobacteroides abscessus subsp. massiliense]SKK50529.1 type IV secretory pathway VirD4 components-like protein [Mycobacteroides abscessus subsp. massiliense]
MSNPSDPIAQIRSAREALTVAEELISAAWPAAAAEYSMEFWKTAASAPLAAILYTVAAARRADGIAGAREIVADLASAYPAPDGREWTAVADRCPNQFLAQCLRSTAAMNSRQRDSVRFVMTRALGAPPKADSAPIAV